MFNVTLLFRDTTRVISVHHRKILLYCYFLIVNLIILTSTFSIYTKIISTNSFSLVSTSQCKYYNITIILYYILYII